MTVLNIIEYPDPMLRKVSQPVTELTDDVKTLIQNMKDTMIACGHAIGLSAIQVGVPLRIIVVDRGRNDLIEYINPVIIESQGKYSVLEGCLSFGTITDGIQRAKRIHFRHDVYAESQYREEVVEDLMAVVIQHEVDHLNGVLMYDHMSATYKKRVDKIFKVKT